MFDNENRIVFSIDNIREYFAANVPELTLCAPLERAECDTAANPAQRDVIPSEYRKNTSGPISAHSISMHECERRPVRGITTFVPTVLDSFAPRSESAIRLHNRAW